MKSLGRKLLVSNAASVVVTTCLLIVCYNRGIIQQLTPQKSTVLHGRMLSEDCCACYTTPDSDEWPSNDVWEEELGSQLSSSARLINNMENDDDEAYDDLCEGLLGLDLIKEGEGMCVIDSRCRFQFCNRDGDRTWNLPAYSVDVRDIDDIEAALNFATKYKIPVTIKNTGHNFWGASVGAGTLNIWMANYPGDGRILEDFRDSCGDQYPVVAIGGGELLNDVMDAVRDDYHVLSGDSRSVGFAGWLQGVGLSHTSRMYGLGIDNVIQFDVIKADGLAITADACTNPDLFWALRGGGGGTFGVVVNTKYRVFPRIAVTVLYFRMSSEPEDSEDSIRQWLTYWAEVSPFLDNRVAGAWFRSLRGEIYIMGNRDLADRLFVDDFDDWFDTVFEGDGSYSVSTYDDWYDFLGGRSGYEDFQDDRDIEDTGHGPRASTRLVPHRMLVDDPEEVVDFLVDLSVEVEEFGAYWLGGLVNDVETDATAVHPAMRSAVWAITTITREGATRVRNFLPNDISGISFNHHSPSEPVWRDALWGEEHYVRLLETKLKYDPQRRFNCWHCVGYSGEEYAEF